MDATPSAQVAEKPLANDATVQKKLQEAYDTATRTIGNIRDCCNDLMMLVDPASLEARATAFCIEAVKGMEPHQRQIEDLMLKHLKGEDVSGFVAKQALAAAAPHYIALQKHEQGIINMHIQAKKEEKKRVRT